MVKLLSFDSRSHTVDGSEIPKNNHLGPGMFFKTLYERMEDLPYQLVSLPDFLNHQTRCLESSAPPGWMVPAKIASEMKVGFTLPAMVFLG